MVLSSKFSKHWSPENNLTLSFENNSPVAGDKIFEAAYINNLWSFMKHKL